MNLRQRIIALAFLLCAIGTAAKVCAESSAAPLKLNILASYPFAYNNGEGAKVGTYWEYVSQLNARSSLEIQQEIVPKARVIEHLKQGLADAAILFKSKRMSQHIEFVSKIREVPIVIASRASLPISHYEALRTLDFVGHFRSGSVSKEFDQDLDINKIAINTYPQMLQMLEKGRVSAIVGNGIVIDSLIRKHCLMDTVSISPHLLGKKEQWLVMSKKSKYLHAIPELSKTLDTLRKEGALDNIFAKHLTQDAAHCRPGTPRP